jgi:hypothetical protein
MVRDLEPDQLECVARGCSALHTDELSSHVLEATGATSDGQGAGGLVRKAKPALEGDEVLGAIKPKQAVAF